MQYPPYRAYPIHAATGGEPLGLAEKGPPVGREAAPGIAGAALRLLLVTPRYLPYVGGTEIHTYEVAHRLAAVGHDVTVLTTDPSGRMAAEEQVERVRILRVRARPAQKDYYFAPGIFHTIRRGHWDLVHCQGAHTFVAPLAMLAARQAGIPYVVTFHSGGHSSRLRNALRSLQWALLRPLLARAEQLIGVSQWEVEFFRQRLQLPDERFALIPNGSYLPRDLAAPASNRRGPLIVSVGRLERYKGHHRVIEALPRVLEYHPQVRLRIVGAGPYEASLRLLAQRLSVTERVEIRSVSGENRQEMASVLSGAALVILLSDYESQGIAVMEALALGRSVLVADCSALSELARSGLAYATPLSSSSEVVAEAITHLLHEPLVPQLVDLPTWEACFANLQAVYYSVLQRAAPSEAPCAS